MFFAYTDMNTRVRESVIFLLQVSNITLPANKLRYQY